MVSFSDGELQNFAKFSQIVEEQRNLLKLRILLYLRSVAPMSKDVPWPTKLLRLQ